MRVASVAAMLLLLAFVAAADTSGALSSQVPRQVLSPGDATTVSAAPAPLSGTWERTGGPPGGKGYDVRFWPWDKDVMLVTDTFAGVNSSEDGGRTWVPSNAGITLRAGLSGDEIPIFSLTFDPNDPDIIWAGTFAGNEQGVYRSTDRGQTWSRRHYGIDIQVGITFRGFTVDPRPEVDIVYAMAELSSWAYPDYTVRTGRYFDMTMGVLYKTTDGGENWSEIWRDDNLFRYLWIDPRDPDVLYVSTGIFDREAANTDVDLNEPGGVGILKSEDGGATWNALNEDNGLDNLYIGSLFMHPEDPDTLIAAAGHNDWGRDTAGVYITNNGGQDWRRVVSDPRATAVEYCPPHPPDPPIAYAAGERRIYRSVDGGVGWTVVADPWGPPGVNGGIPIDMLCDPDDPDRLFINSYGGGNFESLDGGQTWRDASQGYSGAEMRDVAVHPDDPAIVYGFGVNNPWVSEDGGRVWRGVMFGSRFPNTSVTIDPWNPAHLLAADEREGTISASFDGGDSWTEVYDNPKSGSGHGYWAIEFAPSEPSIVYAGIRRLYIKIVAESAIDSYGMSKSTDGGATWFQINGDPDIADKSITDVAVHPTMPDVVYAAAYGSGVLESANGGATWDSTGSSCTKVLALEIDPNHARTLYAGCRRGGAYKTVSGGAEWDPISTGMPPETSVSDILVDPVRDQTVYAGSFESGVFRSENGGASWQELNDGLTGNNRSIVALAISADGQFLYAGTQGAGVFRLGELPSVGGVAELPAADGAPAEVSGSSGNDIALLILAAAVGAGVLIVAGSGWYARKRWAGARDR